MCRLPSLALALLLSLGACRPAAAPRFLLLVTVDTLRADHLGAYGNPRGLTPNLDALARESEVFTAVYAPSGFTLPSVTALLTGRYPEALGVVSNLSTVPEAAPTLATELRRRGWRTGAVVSNLVLRRKAGLAVGFEVYDDELPQREAVRDRPDRVASATTEAALRVLDRLREDPSARIFLWVHYMDPHGPYTPPDGRRERYLEAERRAFDGRKRLPVGIGSSRGLGAIPTYQYLEGEREVAFYRAGYAAEVSYTDEWIGRLLASIRALGLDDEALLVFSADHGEALGENDYWFNHGDYLTDALVRVPLFVRRRGAEPRQRDDVVALVDLYPSILAQLGAAKADSSYPGRDLLARGAAQSGSIAYLATLGGGRVPRFGLVDGGHKLVVSLRRDGRWEAQLFRRGEDDVDLSGMFAQRAAELRRRLVALRGRMASRVEIRQELSGAERERLRTLGYLGEEEVDDVPAADLGPLDR